MTSLRKTIEGIWDDALSLRNAAYLLTESLEQEYEQVTEQTDNSHVVVSITRHDVDARSWLSNQVWRGLDDLENRLIKLLNAIEEGTDARS